MNVTDRPKPGEYDSYYEKYTSLVASSDICATLEHQGRETIALLSTIGEEPRGDRTPMEGFEQDDYIRNARFNEYTLADLIEEFEAVRQSTVLLFRPLQDDEWMRRGVANHKEITVRAIAWITAGHELHHRTILRERYLL
jgi:hypothetical protein